MSSASTTETGGGLRGLSANELATRFAQGDATACEIVEAHIAQIEATDKSLNAVVTQTFDQARQAAEQQDQARRLGTELGPLAGVPITIKECLEVAGTSATFGVPRLKDKLAKQDGPLVARLRQAGALILGKTNVPQLGIYMETDSPLFGRANNPWDLSRSPGGSSGGEAAIIAAGGSPLGLATDAGGSIRHPAHCCGLCGIKPTSGRLTQGDLTVTTWSIGPYRMPVNLAGLQSILQVGPMARQVGDLALLMQVVAAPGQERVDPTVPAVPWPDYTQVDLRGMRIGWYVDDGAFPVSPAIRRAVREAVAAAHEAGAETVMFHPPEVPKAMAVYQSLLFPDGGAAFRRMLGSAPIDPRLKRLLQGTAVPNFVRRPLTGLMALVGQKRMAEAIRSLRILSAHEYRQRISQRAEYTAKFLNAMDEERLDVLICPPHPVPAPPHGKGALLGLIASYTGLFNLLGMPAGVVQATTVRAGEETDRESSADVLVRMAREIEAGSAGLPVGVQVVGRHWREDQVLAVMQTLESRLSTLSDYPRTPVRLRDSHPPQ
jgi:fatty acid amide hydrolase